MVEILFKEESYKIIGACFEVHNILGHGFKEAVYKDALEFEFARLNIPFVRERPFTITYKEQKLKHFFVADFVVYDGIILEVKIGNYIGDPYIKQTLNYLKASGLKLGLVINFGKPSIEYQRVVF
ncbi:MULTISPECIES: GxxExxY protein [Mucilaginibacter]|uniref:GxxExxY protein n=1 Tax=Mucilaginibacter gossypii TaxID=551996 RepID=A0A1G8MVE9_9SPHI|nr:MULTISPECIES: GxxExxY protein [Mucilaginibacter]QTE35693.1 GxxExxY protein [Mucilaginibacter gossypii]RAV56946.1 GxxExxY protein [Mucilaginibacter rubeus]GGB22586.1 GTP-binding protein [Mucilaginibacter rubeus]SDI72008.1 GxxExxY protein [Mucilaginibacter gossypii]